MSALGLGTSLSEKRRGHRWALLIGADLYEDAAISSLKVCASDVQAVYNLLTTSGYEPDRVRLLLAPGGADHKPTRGEILSAISSIAQMADEDDLLLFYFSGHGIAHNNEAFILPTDTRYAAISDTAVSVKRVEQIIQDSAAQAKVIVIDACHSGAQIGKALPEMTKEFMRHVFEEAEGMAVLASCKQEQVSWEWPEKGRSVFTYYLLEGLQGLADFDDKGFVTVSDVNRYVADKVKAWAVQNGRVQTPTLHYTVAGDIVLIVYSSEKESGPLTLVVNVGSGVAVEAESKNTSQSHPVPPMKEPKTTDIEYEQELRRSILFYLDKQGPGDSTALPELHKALGNHSLNRIRDALYFLQDEKCVELSGIDQSSILAKITYMGRQLARGLEGELES